MPDPFGRAGKSKISSKNARIAAHERRSLLAWY
jgi:hypothetical protein